MVVIGVVFAFLWWQGQIKRFRDYWQETMEELKKCSWPTWEELQETFREIESGGEKGGTLAYQDERYVLHEEDPQAGAQRKAEDQAFLDRWLEAMIRKTHAEVKALHPVIADFQDLIESDEPWRLSHD